LRPSTLRPCSSLLTPHLPLNTPQEQILSELRYQSSLDLNEDTYNLVRRLPLAKDMVKLARQQLVMRLDEYFERSRELFEQVGLSGLGAYVRLGAGCDGYGGA
jgi:hypothetical protein